jgi:Leucine-rich repeat (LRR) protein
MKMAHQGKFSLLLLSGFLACAEGSGDQPTKLEWRSEGKHSTIPLSVFENKSVTSLTIIGGECDVADSSCLYIESIPDEVLTLEKLQELNVLNCRVKEIPSFLTSMKTLTVLDLSHNQHINVQGVGRLTNLEVLNLNECALQTLPENITSLRKLQHFGLEGNLFTEQEKNRIKGLLPACKIYF